MMRYKPVQTPRAARQGEESPNEMAEASRSRTYRRRLATTTTGFEDRGNHRITCAPVCN